MADSITSDYISMNDSWRSKYSFTSIFYTNVFISCVCFSIVMPSIYPYVIKHGGDEWFFAACLFIYSLGELIGALGFGYLHNYTKTKIVFYTVTSIGIISGMLYFSADYFGGNVALGLIIGARFATGLWTGGEQALE